MPAKITFLTVIASLILLVLPWWQNPLQLSPAASAQTGPEPIEVTGFDLISASEGWLRLGQHLYWTRNSGQSWTEITPPNLEPAIIQAIWFVDAQSGWLILTRLEAPESIAYSLARTSDGGATWQVTPLSLFAPDDPDALASSKPGGRPAPIARLTCISGGSSRYCSNTALSAALLAQLSRQAWYTTSAAASRRPDQLSRARLASAASSFQATKICRSPF